MTRRKLEVVQEPFERIRICRQIEFNAETLKLAVRSIDANLLVTILLSAELQRLSHTEPMHASSQSGVSRPEWLQRFGGCLPVLLDKAANASRILRL